VAKIHVIPNGVDVERFHPRWPNQALWKEFDLDPEAPLVGIVAALRPEKNHEMFLDVAAAVHRRLPRVRFVVVGDGPQRARLQARADELGIAAAVRFVGTRSDVPEVLLLLDVLLLTSHMEANPLCLLEAMASEKPVVATRVGSVAETVIEGRTGHLVAPGDVPRMAECVLELLADRARAGAIGRAGREHVIAHWSVEGMVQGYEDLITEIYRSKCKLPRLMPVENERTPEGQMSKTK
jgi:glycosyltransferase involved in cell wall biosynthesis